MKLVNLVLLIVVGFSAFAQDQLISLSIDNQPIERVLHEVEKKGNVAFTYNADIVPTDSVVSLHVNNLSVEACLVKLFQSRYQYRRIGNNVIIKPSSSPIKKRTIALKGVVYDSYDQSPLEHVSIYFIQEKKTFITDSLGRYSFEIETTQKDVEFSFSKKAYQDTIMILSESKVNEINVNLSRVKNVALNNTFDEPQNQVALADMTMVKIMVPKEKRFGVENLEHFFDIEIEGFQFSVIPFVGTNGFYSANTNNALSINLIAGYNGGVDGLEVGGALNMIRNDVNGIQAAGLGNVVGGKVDGAQFAGAFNNCRGEMYGLQWAGLSNIALEDVKGGQYSGFSNIARGSFTGAQISGFSNIVTEEMVGTQVSGFSNISADDIKGVQASGFFNYSKDLKGVQAAGFLNISKGDLDGVQAAGFMNISTGEIDGVQVAGFFNRTKELKGTQVAVINVTDTVSKGVSVGLFSFIKKGYRVVELERNGTDNQYGLTLRSGLRKFYNSLRVGTGRYGENQRLYSAGYGIGTSIALDKDKDFFLDLDISSDWYYYQAPNNLHFNLNNSGRAVISWNWGKRFAIYAGYKYNFYIMEAELEEMASTRAKSAASGILGRFTTLEWMHPVFGVRL